MRRLKPHTLGGSGAGEGRVQGEGSGEEAHESLCRRIHYNQLVVQKETRDLVGHTRNQRT
jgi:hypothetical protein